MQATRIPGFSLPVFIAILGIAVGASSCKKGGYRTDDGQPTPTATPGGGAMLHDDPAKEKLVLVTDGTPPTSDPDPVYVSWDGNHPQYKNKYIRWVATKKNAVLTVKSIEPTDGPCKQAATKFADIVCADGQCISRDLTAAHKKCTYTYKMCVDANCQDPTIMIDP